ncbi:MAG TPA: 3-hydroxyacyl-CoA dehydrogenase NAD-binding domain-containing protein, partial [Elusimicrobiota bacterium]|nr:3-hydroxyacyl-CoA dehydrogenase NAD-binding domain-containing protein [Elusimicrobiota bacterium]
MSSSGTVGTVGVVGAGTMGRGIAQLCAQKGFPVLLHDVSTEAAEKAARVIQDDLSSSATKGALTPEEAAQARSRVRPAAALEELASADIVIEAIFEDLAAKRELFARLEPLLKPRAILATNTSSLAVGAIAEGSPSPGRILGMHFFNPATMMRLIEVVRAPLTEEGAFRRAWAFALELGKTPVEAKDTPGFIVNRVVRPFYLQAQSVAGEGGTSFERIDNEVRDLGGLPMGPFKLMDLIGLDVNLAISRSIYQALKKPERLKPHFIQERLVEAG